MLTGKYRQIYYYHLKKCGGSTLNQWLDTLTYDGRQNNPHWLGSWLFDEPGVQTSAEEAAREKSYARAIFQWTDIVHSHAPLRACVPPDTFCFTMLRDPVQRLVSQVLDWRRLKPHDTVDQPAHVRACVDDCRRLPLRDFLLRHAFDGGRMFLNNYQTRAVAAGRIGRLVMDVADASKLLDIAVQSLEADYDFVGLTEQHGLGRNVLCAMLGLPAARTIPVVNDSHPTEKSAAEVADAADVLRVLTDTDQALYARARTLFARRHQAAAQAYDDTAFEATHAAAL
ncbi:MAG TPA: sulfotransferase family 2 domain-containing protein, partial [Rhodopila sp.]|nr:sulfotransferase family 2 domain-containing protein [Rhodopila sp.]